MEKTSFYHEKAYQLKIFAVMFFCLTVSSAQVGIGTETPESSSMLASSGGSSYNGEGDAILNVVLYLRRSNCMVLVLVAQLVSRVFT